MEHKRNMKSILTGLPCFLKHFLGPPVKFNFCNYWRWRISIPLSARALGKLAEKRRRDNRIQEELRMAALYKLGEKYGTGICCINHPEITDTDILVYDHINGNPRVTVQRGKRKGETNRECSKYSSMDILRREHPERKYQILCLNCNGKKTKIKENERAGRKRKYLTSPPLPLEMPEPEPVVVDTIILNQLQLPC